MDDELNPMDQQEDATQEPDEGLKEQWAPWLTRCQERETVFEEKWWKRAKDPLDLYEASKSKEDIDKTAPYNILFANTEVLIPALYSADPRPEITSRKKDDDILPGVLTNYLASITDPNLPGMPTLSSSMENAVVNALVPGAGTVRLKVDKSSLTPITFHSVPYDRFIWGEAECWYDVPWAAFIHVMSKEAIVKLFELPPDKELLLSAPSQEDLDSSRESPGSNTQTYKIYELWLKDTKQVVWLCDGYDPVVLGVYPDPLSLSSFFPTPGPLTLVKKISTFLPTPVYTYYENQAQELNRVTARLNAVLKAIKVRGVYNAIIGQDLQSLLDSDQMENGLIPSTAPVDMSQGGFERHIWLLPIDQLIKVARELYTARQEIKQTIYEITGLADIIRGASVASESATAQNLKDKWGSLRLRRWQKVVRFYARDLLRLAVDAGKMLPPEVWAKLTLYPLPTAQEKQQQMLQLQAKLQPPVMPMGMPPGAPPPQPDPELLKQAQELQSTPSWEDILQTLKDDFGRIYVLDVETDSTVDDAALSNKSEVQEAVQSLSQLMQGMMPLAQVGPQGMQVAILILLDVAKKLRFGREIIDVLKQLTAAPPQGQEQGPDPKVEADKKEAELKMQEAQARHEVAMMKIELEKQKIEFQKQELAMKMALGPSLGSMGGGSQPPLQGPQ